VVLAMIVAQAIETSRPILEERRHHFEVQLPSESVYVEADPTRLAQVILNLLNNAAKYTEEGGRVWLIVELANGEGESPGEVLIRVRDTGMGIPAEMLPHVFDLFTQVDHTLDRAQGGLGIGLTLVRRLVEMHGGTVRAFSEGRGRGSEFVVRLPVVAKPAMPPGVESAERKRKTDVAGRRILIVDDNVDSAESLAIVLRLTGHEAQTAHDGEAALEVARQRLPDIVLLDIGLPRMDGLEVARRLRQDLGLKDALLIAMTGYGQDEDKRRSQDAGFNAHLTKPVELSELQALLTRFTPAETGAPGS
jgi:CheY-like chemotaxis protein